MSSLLLDWIRKLGIDLPSDDIESTFSNGYYLGRVVAKVLKEDIDVLNANVNIARNYTILEKKLQTLGIILSPSDAMELIHAAKGVAPNLLYKIKCSRRIIVNTKETNFDQVLKRRLGQPFHPIEKLSRVPKGEPIVVKEPIKYRKPKQEQEKLKPKAKRIIPARLPKADPRPAIPTCSSVDSFEIRESESINSIEKEFIETRNKLPTKQHLEVLAKMIPNSEDSNHVAQSYINRIRENKAQSQISLKDREQRRKKLLLAQEQAQKSKDAKKLQESLHLKLLHLSKQERRIAEQLMQVRNEKQIIADNRAFREKQYQKQREIEYKLAIDNEYLMYEEARKEYQKATELQLVQHKAILDEKRRKKHLQNTEFCNRMVDNLVSMALILSEHKIVEGSKAINRKKLRELTNLFLEGIVVTSDTSVSLTEDFIPKATQALEDPKQNPTLDLLDLADLNDYLNNKNDWEQKEMPLKNKLLDNIVDNVLRYTSEDIKSPVMESVSDVLRIIIIGKPYSGKKTIAQKICDKFDLRLLHIDSIIQEATNVNLKDLYISNNLQAKRSIEEIGARIQMALMEGNSPDDSLLVDLLINVIALEPKKGWVLVDFPKTKEQAILLEKELSGYEDPKPTRKGNFKRPGSKLERNNFRLQSLISSGDSHEDLVVNPVSGLDAVFLLDLPNEECITRCAGQLINADTKIVLHIENNPPQLTTPGLMDKIQPQIDASGGRLNLHYHLDAFEQEATKLQNWISKFNILHVLDATREMDIGFDQVCLLLQEKALVKKGQNSFAEAPKELNREAVASAYPNDADISVEKIPGHIKRVKNNPSKELSTILLDQWISIESNYTDVMKFAFRSIRRGEDSSAQYFFTTENDFKKFLGRPDKEQLLLDAFQAEYNSLDEDLRQDSDVKAELHQQAEDLKEKLWEMADRRREEAENERIGVIESKWVEDQSYILCNIYILMMQAEVDRYQAARQFIYDFKRDSCEINLLDPLKAPFKIPLVQPTANPPIDISSLLIAAHQQFQQKLKTLKQTQQGINQKQAVPGATSKEKKASQAKQVDHQPAKHIFPTERDLITVDFEAFVPTEIVQAADLCMSNLTSLNAFESPAGKDKKKGGDSDTLSSEEEEKLQKALEIEEKILISRLERIKIKGCEHLKSFRNKALQVFINLDELIGHRFAIEMMAVKDLVNVIREAIEFSQKLPNRLLLQGDKVIIDFSTLVYQPEEEVSQVATVAKASSDQFTPAQLLSMAKQFQLACPSGNIGCKAFVELLSKTCQINDAVCDDYAQADYSHFLQLCYVLDPLEQGMISWRKFLLIHCNVLPISLEGLQVIKDKLNNLQTNEISYNDFAACGICWDEQKIENNEKLKRVLFGLLT